MFYVLKRLSKSNDYRQVAAPFAATFAILR